jgi:hypothetical protein
VPNELRISIESDFSQVRELATQLQSAVPSGVASFEIERQESEFRLEPTVLVALITAGGTVLSALITGLLTTSKGRKSNVVIETANGTKVELPGDSTPEQIQQALRGLSAPSGTPATFSRTGVTRDDAGDEQSIANVTSRLAPP